MSSIDWDLNEPKYFLICCFSAPTTLWGQACRCWLFVMLLNNFVPGHNSRETRRANSASSLRLRGSPRLWLIDCTERSLAVVIAAGLQHDLWAPTPIVSYEPFGAKAVWMTKADTHGSESEGGGVHGEKRSRVGEIEPAKSKTNGSKIKNLWATIPYAFVMFSLWRI